MCDRWYQTAHGQWMAGREKELLWRLMQPSPGDSVLDVGCGTGFFSRHWANSGLKVVGVDIDRERVDYAARQCPKVRYLVGDAKALPFSDKTFDHAVAVTSLCFVTPPAHALEEMLRVARRTVLLGLLNRRSLLYLRKAGRKGYIGVRWDDLSSVREWLMQIAPIHRSKWCLVTTETAIHAGSGAPAARWLERILPARWPYGSFMAVKLIRRG
ncbi:MAG: class I SAM-dependent methyltransferase [Magnetococcales bacterium]|nr:class I SAM-dependent methyltransferase [Magnetococcales bacterium]